MFGRQYHDAHGQYPVTAARRIGAFTQDDNGSWRADSHYASRIRNHPFIKVGRQLGGWQHVPESIRTHFFKQSMRGAAEIAKFAYLNKIASNDVFDIMLVHYTEGLSNIIFDNFKAQLKYFTDDNSARQFHTSYNCAVKRYTNLNGRVPEEDELDRHMHNIINQIDHQAEKFLTVDEFDAILGSEEDYMEFISKYKMNDVNLGPYGL